MNTGGTRGEKGTSGVKNKQEQREIMSASRYKGMSRCERHEKIYTSRKG